MTLPSAWVDRIFDKLTVTYGQRFLGLYSGINLDAVKSDWAYELRGLAQSPNAIKYALEHLNPEKAPNVLDFRDACRRAPSKAPVQIPPPAADPEMARRAMESITKPEAHDPKAWAWALKEREEKGAKLTGAQRSMWRAAINPRSYE